MGAASTDSPAESRSIIGRALRNLGFLIGGKSVRGVFGLVYLALAVRTLGIEAYGQLVLIHSFVLAISTIVKFQTWQPILRYGTPALRDGRLHDFKRLVRFTVGLDIASSLAGAALAAGGVWLMGTWFGLPAEVVPLASAYSVSLLFMVTATPDGLLRLLDRFDLLSMEENIEAGIRLAGSLLLFAIGGSLQDFLLVWLLSVMGSGCGCAILAWREVRRRGLWQPGADACTPGKLTEVFGGLWKFVWVTNATSSLNLLTNHVAVLSVGAMIGPVEAALFRVARQVAEALAKPVKMMTMVIYPEFARLAADGSVATLRAVTRRALVISCAVSAGCFVVLALGGPWLLALIGGHETAGAYHVMVLLGGAALIGTATFTLEPTLVSLDRPAMALWVRAGVGLVYLPLLFILTKMSGIEGAGSAAVIAAMLTAILQYFAVSSWFRSWALADGRPL